jgi:hypothetical protein
MQTLNKISSLFLACRDRREKFISRDSPPEAISKCFIMDSKCISGVAQNHCAMWRLNDDISAGIASLFRLCSPTAIVLAIPEIVVNSVHAMFGAWSHTHIGKKILERFPPAIADRYSSQAVLLG